MRPISTDDSITLHPNSSASISATNFFFSPSWSFNLRSIAESAGPFYSQVQFSQRSPLLAAFVDRLPPLGVEVVYSVESDAGGLRRAGDAELLVGVVGWISCEEYEEGGCLGVASAAVVGDEVVAELEDLYVVVYVRGCFARVLEQRQRARLARPLRPHAARAARQRALQPADGVPRRALLAL